MLKIVGILTTFSLIKYTSPENEGRGLKTDFLAIDPINFCPCAGP